MWTGPPMYVFMCNVYMPFHRLTKEKKKKTYTFALTAVRRGCQIAFSTLSSFFHVFNDAHASIDSSLEISNAKENNASLFNVHYSTFYLNFFVYFRYENLSKSILFCPTHKTKFICWVIYADLRSLISTTWLVGVFCFCFVVVVCFVLYICIYILR